MIIKNTAGRGWGRAGGRLTSAAAAIVLTVSVAVCAQHPDAGTTAFPFLNMGYDARAVGMAGAAAGMPNDIYGALSNPAAIASVNRNQIMAGYRQLFMDVWGGPLGIACPTSKGVFAASLITLSVGEFDVVNDDGDATGLRAQSSYAAVGVSWGKTMRENVTVGATVKGIYHYIGDGAESYGADGFAADLGVQYRLNGGRLIYGAVLRNFGVMRSGYLGKFNEYPLPYGVEAGLSYVPRHIQNLRGAFDVSKTKGDYLNFEPGVEYSLLGNTLLLRGGYTFSYMDLEKMFEVFRGERDDAYSKSNVNTFSLGLGIASTADNVDIRLDAAAQFYAGVSEPGLVISLTVGF